MCKTETLQQLQELELMKKMIDDEIKTIKSEILAEYGKEKNTIQIENFTININLVKRCSLDSTRLKREHPSIYELYKKESSYNTIKVK